MSKAILEFTLPDENYEFKISQKAGAMCCALDEIKNYLRGICKYQDEEFGKMTGSEAAEKIYERFYEILGENDCSNLD
jgi:hypothetical protein